MKTMDIEVEQIQSSPVMRILPGTRPFWQATIALSIASFLTFATIYLTQPLLPIFTKEFGVSPAVSSLSVSLTIFSLGLGLLFYGPLSDAVGRKPVMFWSMALSVIPTLLTPFVDNFYTLLGLRMVEGFCLAGLPAVAMAYLAEEYSPGALGLAVGLYISGNTLGGMGGRIVSGIMVDFFSWRASFFLFGIITLLGLAVFYFLLPASRFFSAKPFNLKDAVLSMFRHLRSESLRYSFLIGFLLMFCFVGIYNYLTFLLSGAPYRLSSSLIGSLFLTYFAGTVSSTLTGRVLDRIGGKKTIFMGLILAVIGLCMLLIPSLLGIIAGLLVFCFGFFGAHASASAWVNQHATEARASASGLYLIFYYAGGSLGSTLLGFLWKLGGWTGVVEGAIAAMLLAFWAATRLHK
ncbi:MFS transporter [Effusibacillus dendaii]|uniref:MFS transporter n=1 Tax=Effusibacillus dendaii TaxID=2743772 RepID=A0A7I8DEB3_9BACL|nr:MFS transporter [Effusibacillus dendaii]BCJ88548.1 MFS transporter [Effusibacillus dendaii]